MTNTNPSGAELLMDMEDVEGFELNVNMELAAADEEEDEELELLPE